MFVTLYYYLCDSRLLEVYNFSVETIWEIVALMLQYDEPQGAGQMFCVCSSFHRLHRVYYKIKVPLARPVGGYKGGK